MPRTFRCLALLSLLLPSPTTAQAGPPPPVDSTLFVTSSEIRDAFTPADSGPVADARLRLVPVGAYNVGISVVRRSQVDGRTPPDAIVHDRITEVYQITEGAGSSSLAAPSMIRGRFRRRVRSCCGSSGRPPGARRFVGACGGWWRPAISW